MSLGVVLVVGLIVLGGSRQALADRAIVVELGSATPFDAPELVAALRVRLAAEGAAVHVRVTGTGDGVRIEARGSERDIPLHGLVGRDAARLVALAASDFVEADLAAAPIEVRAMPVARHRATTLGLLGGAAAWDGVLGGVTLDLAVSRPAWLLGIELGGSRLVDGPLSLTSGVVRVTGGRRDGWFETRAGITLAPVLVSSGLGDTTLLVGAGASERLRLPLRTKLRAVLAVGLDVYAGRTTYAVEGMTVTTTPRWAPWLGLGFEVMP